MKYSTPFSVGVVFVVVVVVVVVVAGVDRSPAVKLDIFRLNSKGDRRLRSCLRW